MKKEEKGFTLIEMLSVVVILGITFMFILPSLVELFTFGNKTEIELIEETVLRAAKEYVNNVDGSFYMKFYKEGDINYIYKSDLINAGMITEEEISKLDTFAGVKGELLSNDRMKYTIQYINVSNNNYTNEELYLMMKNMNSRLDNLEKNGRNSTEIESLKNRIEEIEETTVTNETISEIKNKISDLTDKESNNNIFLKNYPVGSVYVSTSSTNPGDTFGGTWEQLKDRFLLGAGDTYTAGSTGGESEHTLTIDEMPNHNHGIRLRAHGQSEWASYTTPSEWSIMIYNINSVFGPSHTTGTAYLNANANTYNIGGSLPHNNMPPYLTVYMWKRTA